MTARSVIHRMASMGLLLWLAASMSSVSAQTEGTPKDMEDNPWKILSQDFDDDRLQYLYGEPEHLTEQNLYNIVTLGESYGVHLARRTYPNPDPAFNLTQTDCAGLSESNIDDILLNAANTTEWFRKKGFSKNGRHFNIVPNYSLSGDRKPGWANLIVCKNRPGVAYILNLRDQKQSNFLGLKDDYTEVLKHPIHRMVIPHELTHVYQMNFMPYTKSGGTEDTAVKTVREGLADATGLMSVFDRYGRGGSLTARQNSYLSDGTIKGISNKLSKRIFMMRAYNVPLQINEGRSTTLNTQWSNAKGQSLIQAVDADIQKKMSYQTSGFFYHLLERYLRKPGDVTTLYKKFDTRQDTQNIYPNLDRFLKSKSKVKTKGPVLGLVLAQFLTEYSEWWDFRTAGKVKESEWLDVSFGKCPVIKLTESKVTAHKETDFSQFAGGCFDIELGGKLPERFPELELLVTSADGDPDRIYLGMGRVEQGGATLYSCHEFSRPRSLGGTFPCLLNPVQGRTSRAIRSLAGKKIRAFYYPSLEGPAVAGPIKLRVVLADVPDDLAGKGVNARRAQASTYRLTASVDSMVVKGNGVPSPKGNTRSNPSGQTGSNKQLREARPPRLTRSDGPLSPTGTKTAMSAKMRDVLNQTLASPVPGAHETQDAIGQTFYQIDTSTEQSDGPELGFRTQEDYFGNGKVGRFPVQAFYGFENEIGVQNPEKPSSIEITLNSDDAMAYSATLHVCTYIPSQMFARIQSGKPFDPCQDGVTRTYEIESSVAFPALLPGISSRAGGFIADEQSQALRDYQNVRLARMGLPEAINDSWGNGGDVNGGSPDSTGPSLPTSTIGGEALPLTCSIRKPDQNCDCSCAAKTCLDQARVTNSVKPSDLSCRLTCGKRWKTCPASGVTP